MKKAIYYKHMYRSDGKYFLQEAVGYREDLKSDSGETITVFYEKCYSNEWYATEKTSGQICAKGITLKAARQNAREKIPFIIEYLQKEETKEKIASLDKLEIKAVEV